MDTVTLKNGTIEFEPLVRATYMSIGQLFNNEPIAFVELVELCKDRDHELFGNTEEVLKARTLLQPNGTVHESVRNVVQSAVQGEGLEMTLTWPGKADDSI